MVVKSRMVFALLVCVLAGTVVWNGGCARACPMSDHKVILPEGVSLPKGFSPMKGLAEEDYVDGWPRYIVCEKDGSVMALVPETRVVLGSDEHEADEAPAHEVTVGPFYIDLYEVNNAQFNRFAEHAKCWGVKGHPCESNALQAHGPGEEYSPDAECLKAAPCKVRESVSRDLEYFKEYWTPGINDSHPARAVSWWEAWYYCQWAGKDLPTEAEWELAAKGRVDSSEYLYPWGKRQPDGRNLLCNYGGPRPAEDGYEYTAPVAAFAAGRSPYGCYNMAGNVWEWCKDNYDASAYSATTFAAGARIAGEMQRQGVDPKGPMYGDMKVLRGGSFTSDIRDCRTTSRAWQRPNSHQMNVGFRGVLRIR